MYKENTYTHIVPPKTINTLTMTPTKSELDKILDNSK